MTASSCRNALNPVSGRDDKEKEKEERKEKAQITGTHTHTSLSFRKDRLSGTSNGEIDLIHSFRSPKICFCFGDLKFVERRGKRKKERQLSGRR